MSGESVELKVFRTIEETFNEITAEFVKTISGNIIDDLRIVLLSAITGYLTWLFYNLTFATASAKEIGLKIVGMIVIGSCVFWGDSFLSEVVPFMEGFQAAVIQGFSFMKEGDKSTDSIFIVVDKSMTTGWDLFNKSMEKVSELSFIDFGIMFQWILNSLLSLLSIFFIAVVGALNMLIAGMLLKILIAISPFFIASLLFRPTSRLFDNWLGVFLNNVFILALTSVILTLAIVVYTKLMEKTTGVDQPLTLLQIEIQILVSCYAFYRLLKEIPRLAGALSGSMAASFSGVRDMAHGAAQAGRDVRNTQQMVKQASKVISQNVGGAVKAAASVASSSGSGNSIKEVPAYRSAVMNRLGRRP